jgi:tetratricopeptide (TPR) repeat protein
LYRIDLALSYSNLGFIQMRSGQLVEAFDSVRRANAIQRTLVVEHPEDAKLRHTLALSTQGMASILNTLSRWKESRPLFVESVEIMSRVVSENPAVTNFRRVLATSAEELGQALIDHDEIKAGLIAFSQARVQADTVRRTNPDDVRNLNSLASIHRGIGKTLAKQGKTADALASLRAAIVLGERIAAEDNLFTYDLACGLALYGEIAGSEQAAPDKEMKKNSQYYSDKAMTVLQQAVDRGWRQAEWIEHDPELRSLRSRADFQALIRSLRQKPKSAPADR